MIVWLKKTKETEKKKNRSKTKVTETTGKKAFRRERLPGQHPEHPSMSAGGGWRVSRE